MAPKGVSTNGRPAAAVPVRYARRSGLEYHLGAAAGRAGQLTEGPEVTGDPAQQPEDLVSEVDEQVRMMFRKGQYAEAVPFIQEHLKSSPDDVPAYELMATALKLSGAKSEAAGALLTAGEQYAQKGMVLASIAAQKKAMKLGVDPDYTAARAARAVPQRVPTPLLDALSDDEFGEMAASLVAHEYDDGDEIVEEGTPGDSLFVVVRGRVGVSTRKGAEEVPLAELSSGDFFGEAALLSGRPRTATIRALGPSECLELTRTALDAMIEKHPRVRQVMEEFNARRAHSTIETLLGKRGD